MAMKPLRIGIVAHGGSGGSGTVAACLAHGLGCLGHEVHLVTTRACARLHPKARLTVHVVEAAEHAMWQSAPWSLALATTVARVAQRHDLDVLHAHFAVPYAISADLARQLLDHHVPLVITLHGTDVTHLAQEPSYGPLVRLALGRAEAITVPSAALGRAAAAIDEALRIQVVPNFVDADQFVPDPSRGPPEAGAELVLGHASNFRPIKRLGDVLAIFERVAGTRPARLLLVGDGPERPAILAAIADRGLSDRVEAPGYRSDVERWLRRAHVALVPSEEESFGLAALEALACGTPVVGSRVGGLSEVVIHERTGLLAPMGNVEAMADHVLALAEVPERWAALSHAAADDARARFSTQAALDAYEAIYRRVVRQDRVDHARPRALTRVR